MYFIYLVSKNTFSVSPSNRCCPLLEATSVDSLLNVPGQRVAFFSFSLCKCKHKNAAECSRVKQSMSNRVNCNVHYAFDSSLSDQVVATEVV